MSTTEQAPARRGGSCVFAPHRHWVSVEAVRARFDAALMESGGEDDHLLVGYPPTAQLSTHRGHLRSPTYFAASCRGAPPAIIRPFGERQRRPE